MAASSPANWQRALFVTGSVVLVVAALSLAKAILIPVVLAILLTLILNPVVAALQRAHLGRVPSVIGVVFLAFCLLGGIGLGVTVQLKDLATDLPGHKHEIVDKIERVRQAGRGSWLVDIYDTVIDISRTIQGTETASAGTPGGEPLPVRIETSPFPWLQSVAGPVLEVLLTAGMTLVLLVFMLIQREDLRNRLIRLWGDRSIASMTKAFDDAVRRISRFLLVQLGINATFGIAMTVGLYLIGVPYALLWGFLAGTLRYIPYVGTWIGALLPIALSIAVLPGWNKPLLVIGLFAFLELITYYIAEPLLFGQSIGVSATALLIAAAFWGWLWGPIGLVIATPLTACLAVLGRYVPHLEFFSILLGDEPVLEPHVVHYQRLLAKDSDEATELVEEFIQTHPTEEVFDQVLVPALVLFRESRARGEISHEDEQFSLQATQEILEDLVLPQQQSKLESTEEETAARPEESTQNQVLVFGCPARDAIDELALSMFERLLDPSKCRLEIISHNKLTAEIIDRVRQEQPKAICIASVPSKGLAHTRYLCKRLRSQFADLKILIGCWGLKQDLEQTRKRLIAAGADQVGATLLETRDQLVPLIQLQANIQQTSEKLAGSAPMTARAG
jgi:predicted PurR-regulated permease PerM